MVDQAASLQGEGSACDGYAYAFTKIATTTERKAGRGSLRLPRYPSRPEGRGFPRSSMTDFLFGYIATPFDDMDFVNYLVRKSLDRLVRQRMASHPKSAQKCSTPRQVYVSADGDRIDIGFSVGRGDRLMGLTRHRYDDVDPAHRGFSLRMGNRGNADALIRAVLRDAQAIASGGTWVSCERDGESSPVLVCANTRSFVDLYREPFAGLGATDLMRWEAARMKIARSTTGQVDILNAGMSPEHVAMVIRAVQSNEQMESPSRADTLLRTLLGVGHLSSPCLSQPSGIGRLAAFDHSAVFRGIPDKTIIGMPR